MAKVRRRGANLPSLNAKGNVRNTGADLDGMIGIYNMEKIFKVVKLYGEGFLCVVPNADILVDEISSEYALSAFVIRLEATGLTSLYALSALSMSLVATGLSSAYNMCNVANQNPIAQPTSDYQLSVA